MLGHSDITCTPTPHTQVTFSTHPAAGTGFLQFSHCKRQLQTIPFLSSSSLYTSAFKLWGPAGLSPSQPSEAAGNRAQGQSFLSLKKTLKTGSFSGTHMFFTNLQAVFSLLA